MLYECLGLADSNDLLVLEVYDSIHGYAPSSSRRPG